MNNFQIETAQNVSISQKAAGIGERILAFLIDSLLIGLYVFVILFYAESAIRSVVRNPMVFMISSMVPVFLYHLLWEVLWNGRSPGKAAMKLRVVMLDGTTPGFSNYLLRWLLRIIEINISGGALAVVSIVVNGKGQRIGDLAAGTTVVSENFSRGFDQLFWNEIPEDYTPSYPQVLNFNDSEIQTVKTIFSQARKDGSHAVIIRLADRIARLMEVEPAENPIDFIERVLQDYNYYTQQL